MSAESAPRKLMTIAEAHSVVYDAGESLLGSQDRHHDDENPFIANHIVSLLEKIAAIRSYSRLVPQRAVPLVDLDSLLSDINLEIGIRRKALTPQNGEDPIDEFTIPPELGSLYAVKIHTEAAFGTMDESWRHKLN